MTDIKPIEFIGSFPELLKESENSDPRMTKIGVFQLPVTPQLQPRYCMVFSGPEAPQLQQIVLHWVDQLADHIAQKKAGV